MNMPREQYTRIEKYFPVQRGNVKIDNYTFINAILYVAKMGANGVYFQKKANGTAYTKDIKKWCINDVIQHIFNALQQEQIVVVKVEVLVLDSTSCKLLPDANGALKTKTAIHWKI